MTQTRFRTFAISVFFASAIAARNAVASPLIEPSPGALTNALAQIAALQAEARALSPAQKKIATPLLDALREWRGIAPRAYAPKIRSNQKLLGGNKILVDIHARVTDALLRYLNAQGAMIQNFHPQYDNIRAEIPLAVLDVIAARADVKFIRPAEVPVANAGTATSEGFYGENVDSAQIHFGVNGSGVKVGVISDSVRYLANSQANNDLGPVTILPGQDGIGPNGDEGEGTAMLEIVHDIAAGAQLYFATGFGGEPSMASNIIALADAGCDIIVDDVTYADESPFAANQPISQAVQTVSDRGVLYFSSAANAGNLTHGTSGTWTGDFHFYNYSPGLGQLHDWGGTPFNQITQQDGGVNLFWSDPLGGATNDYNLFITDSNGNVLRQSITVQNGSNDPYESVAASTNSGEYVVVALAAGVQRDIYVSTGRGHLAHGTSASTRGHNAAPAANAFSVAAVTAKGIGPGFQISGGTNSYVELFSCDGNPRLFYETDGSAVTPSNLSSTGGRILLKPEITAADGVTASTNTFPTNVIAFTPFYGTSAAAPHAAAIAALLRSYRSDLTPAQIRTALTNTAMDIEAPGFDLVSGFGVLKAELALDSVDNTAPLVAVTNPANGSAIQLLSAISGTASDVGSGLENNEIHFTLFNNGNFWSGSYWTNTTSSDPTISLTANVVNGAWTFTNVPAGGNQLQGTYYVSAFARDNAGNTSQAQSGVTSTSFAIDTDPPSVEITFPANGSTITNSLSGNWFQGTASDNPGNNLSVSLFIRRNSDNLYWTGSGWGDATNGFISNSYNSGAGTWQSTGGLPAPGSSLANGDYHFIAIAKDAAGNQQQMDSIVTVDFHPVYVFNFGSQYGSSPNMNWSDPANWDVGSVPTPDARVIINNYSPNSTSLGNIQVYDLEISGGTLTTAGMQVQKLNLSGGGLSGSSFTLGANGTGTWSGGSLSSGMINIQSGATFNIASNTNHDFPSCIFTNYGTVVWSGGLIQTGGSSPGTPVYNYGMWDIQCDQTWNNNYGYSGSSFNNYGTFRKSAGNQTNQTVFASGVFFRHLGGVIDIQQGNLSLQSGATFSSGYIATNATGTLLLSSGNFNINGTVTSSNLVQNTGALVGDNVISGELTWDGGTWSGSVTISSNSTVYCAGGSGTLDSPSTIVTNYGAVVWSSGTWRGGGNSPGLAVYNFGLWDIHSDLTLNNDFGYAGTIFNNFGVLRKSAGSQTNQTLFAPGVFYNQAAGVLDVEQGTFALRSGANLNGGYVATNTTGTLLLSSGSFNINGTTTPSNVVENAGVLIGNNIITGALTWVAGSWSCTMTIASNSTLYCAGGTGHLDLPSTILTNYGTVNWNSGLLRGGGSSPGTPIYNFGLWDIQDDLTLNNDFSYAGTTFNNYGILRKSAGNQTNQAMFTGGVFFNQRSGALDVEQGNLSLQGSADFSGGYVTTNTASTVLLAGGSFLLDGTVTSTNVIESGGNLIGNNIIAGALNWVSGYWAGTVTIASNSTLFCVGSTGTLDFPSTIVTNYGTVNWSSGLLRGGGNSPGTPIYNFGLWDIRDDLALNNNFGYAGATFNNYGVLRKSAGAQTNRSVFAGVLYNQTSGVLDVQQGNLSLEGNANFNGGYVTTNSTGMILLTSGSFNINGSVTSSNVMQNAGYLAGNNVIQGALTWLAGNWDNSIVTIAPDSTVFLEGTNNLDLASMILTNNGTVVWHTGLLQGGGSSPGTQVYNFGLWDAQDDLTWNNAFGYAGTSIQNYGVFRKSAGATTNQTTLTSGVFYNQPEGVLDVRQGTLSLQGSGNFAGGYVTNSSGTVLLASGSFNLNGVVTSSNVVENAGVLVGNNMIRGALTWTGGNWNGASVTVATNSTLYIAAGTSHLDMETTIVTNSGTVIWTSGTLQSGGSSPGTLIYNYGLWDAQGDHAWNNAFGYSGTLFHNFGILRKELSTGITTFDSIFLDNPGTQDLRSGTFAINGGYSTAPSAQLKISIAGPDAGTNFGNESFTGNASFDGTLAVSLANSFVPTNGETFVIANYPSRSGQFATTQLPPLPFNSSWSVNYGATALTLTVVPQASVTGDFASNGDFQITLTGPPASSAVLWASSNLFSWDPLFTNAPFTGIIVFDDPQAALFTKRFYRAVIQP